MPQLFSPAATSVFRLTLAGSLPAAGLVFWTLYNFNQPDHIREKDVTQRQPVPFSHKHHVAGLGIDCRYCHTSVQESSFANIPPTETCMTCHSQIWTESEMLRPVRESYFTNTPIKWNRVTDMPDFVQFHHGVHVNNGISCRTCHGPVGQMPLVWQENAMSMSWCLDCHENPQDKMVPPDKVVPTNLLVENFEEFEANQWVSIMHRGANEPLAVADEKAPELEPADLAALYDVHSTQLNNCSICHY